MVLWNRALSLSHSPRSFMPVVASRHTQHAEGNKQRQLTSQLAPRKRGQAWRWGLRYVQSLSFSDNARFGRHARQQPRSRAEQPHKHQRSIALSNSLRSVQFQGSAAKQSLPWSRCALDGVHLPTEGWRAVVGFRSFGFGASGFGV